jgi:lipopolysaccharide transport system ATP-binding protein
MQPVIKIENVSKEYRLGQIGTKSLTDDLKIWWSKVRRQPHPLLRVGHVDRRYMSNETIWALKDVSLQVDQGEALGIIGRNGAGKSTLLKVLSRVTAPTRGEIKIKGRIASLLEIGTGFHPDLTGQENIYLNGAIMGMSRKEVRRKFDEIVDFAGVEKFIDTPVKRYSSGMYVRLAFAVAAHLDPEILLVDEVLAVGDAEFQKKCLGKMGKVAKEGRTVLFVSHNMAAIETLCRSCLLLKSGEIVKVGPTDEVVSEYLLIHKSEQKVFSGIIQQIVSLNESGAPANFLKAGQPIRLHIHLDLDGLEVKTPTILLGFNNALGQRIFTVSTDYSTSQLPELNGKSVIECRIPSESLVPGEYSLKAIIARNLLEPLETIDNAATLTIEATDFFGTGKLPTAAQGVVMAQSEWEVCEEAGIEPDSNGRKRRLDR